MRLESLTFLRFLAAFIVVTFHYGSGTWYTRFFDRIATSGPQMVSFFFVLSGFVMIISQYGKQDFSSGKFYYARIARIVPLYLFGLILVIPLRYGIHPISNGTSLVLNLAFLQTWFPPYSLSFNGPSWSVSVEMFFYLSFPFLLFVLKKIKPQPKNVVIASLVFWAFSQAILLNLLNSKFYTGFPSRSHDLLYYLPLVHYCSFFMGVAVGFLFLEKRKWLLHVLNYRSVFAILVSFVILYFSLMKEPQIKLLFGLNFPFGASFWAPVFAFVIIAVGVSENNLSRFLEWKFFIFLGEISFSIYILHSPIHELIKASVLPSIYKSHEFSKTFQFNIYLIIVILVSTMGYYFIEKPLQKVILSKKKNRNKGLN